MSGAALVLLLIPGWIAKWFTPDVQVIAAASVLLRIAAFFQLFDGLQIVASGALRGVGDTRTAMLCHLGGYWGIGLPLGASLCFGSGMGAAGLWIGLSAGLIVIGVSLAIAWWRMSSKMQAPQIAA